ncbi:MAG: outer membrane beta-barrel protein [Alphaproteobacteria bacterium]|nr:outer membrane beta-barrel protein [Alphaproteobacteria bacterium]
MKKLLLLSLVLGFSAQAEDGHVDLQKSWWFYGGADLVSSWTSSDFHMDYDYDYNAATADPETRPYANNKKNNIGRVGVGLFAGARKNFQNSYFLAGEVSYIFSDAHHKHDFPESEDAERFYNVTAPDRISYIDIKHGNELGLSFRFGKEFKSCGIYGILGMTTKDVEIRYGTDASHIDINDEFEVSPKKRAYGAVFGLGVSKNINERTSFAFEYKYKTYGSAKKSVDCREASRKMNWGRDHDNSDRNFKVRSDKHELALRFIINV